MATERKKQQDRERMQRIRAETASRLFDASWREIESAPMDGTTVLLYCPKGDGSTGSTYRVTAGFWDTGEGYIKEHRDLDGRYLGQDEQEPWEWWLTLDGGFSEETMMPTHWMPMPSPPSSKGVVRK